MRVASKDEFTGNHDHGPDDSLDGLDELNKATGGTASGLKALKDKRDDNINDPQNQIDNASTVNYGGIHELKRGLDKANLNAVNEYLTVNHNEIFLHPVDDLEPASTHAVLAFIANALSLNYAITGSSQSGVGYDDLVERLGSVSAGTLSSVLDVLKESRGAAYDYRPMYPDFPEQVAEASDEELVKNAFLHYLGDWIGVRIMPDYTPSPRIQLIDGLKPTAIRIISRNDVLDVLKRVVSSSQVWSDDQKWFIRGVFSLLHLDETVGVITEWPKIHENAVFLYALLRELDGSDLNVVLPCVTWNHGEVSKYVDEDLLDSVTDVLRLAAFWSSDGDASLSAPVKFKLNRSKRKLILFELGRILKKNPNEDQLSDEFHRYEEEWKRLATTLHYQELVRNVLPHSPELDSARSWLALVQSGGTRSLDGIVDGLIRDLREESDGVDRPRLVNEIVGQLKSRPGVFARRLVELLRKLPEEYHGIVLTAFNSVARNVSNRVLIQLWGFLNTRLSDGINDLDKRMVIMRTPHGQKTSSIDNTIVNDVTVDEARFIMNGIESALKDKRKNMKTFLDVSASPDGRYVVPMGVGSVSSGVKLIGRGSRFKIPGWGEQPVVRVFMHWHDLNSQEYGSRVDLDMSTVFFDEGFKNSRQVSYTNLREGRGIVHSGDITSAPDGAAEFIDVNVRYALDTLKVRYVVPSVYSYTMQYFSKIPEACAGVMLKTELGRQTGEIFDPKNVALKWSLTKESTNSTPFILDLLTGEVTWVDVDAGSNISLNRVDGNEPVFATIAKNSIYSRPMTVDKALSLLTIPVDKDGVNDDVRVIHPDDSDAILDLIGE
jgi:hypothetical protein